MTTVGTPDAGVAAPPDFARVVPQRLVLVLPTTAEFDSRTYRIASAAVARGHSVTVIARSGPGLADDEVHPAGYRIRRVPSRLVDGLPGPLRSIVARLGGDADRRSLGGADPAGPPAPALETAAGPAPTPALASAPTPTPARRVARLGSRVAGKVLRRFAIPLVIRAQRRGARSIAPEADIVHGMAYLGIPIALDLGRRTGARTVYDARDIYVDAANLARSPRWFRWLVGRAERGWARAADLVITVNDPYADVMARRWRIDRPVVVMNCSMRFDPKPEPDGRFQRAAGIDPATRIVLYQGGFSRDRGIEQLIAAIPLVPNAALILMGYGSREADLRARASSGEAAGRVFVLPGVPPPELLAWVAAADVVAMPIQGTTLNHRLTTPNKLFEAMAAGVPVVASDLPGMAPIVRATGVGRLVDPTDPGAIAGAIREILDAPPEARRALRATALHAAHETFNWDAQAERLFGEYGRLTGRPW
jgi:glycosyltransferase involved in cell wall biosynthesis